MSVADAMKDAKLSEGVKKYIASLGAASVAELTFTQKLKLSIIALKEQAVAFLASPLGKATLVVAGIALVAKGLHYLATASERAYEKFEKLQSQYEQTVSDAESLEAELKSVKEQLDELNNVDAPELVNKEEITKLEATRDLLAQQLAYKQKLALFEQREAAKAAYKTLTASNLYLTGGAAATDSGMMLPEFGYRTIIDKLASEQTELTRLEQSLFQAYSDLNTMAVGSKAYKTQEAQIDYLEDRIATLSRTVLQSETEVFELYSALLDDNGVALEGYEGIVGRIQTLLKIVSDVATTTEAAVHKVVDAGKEVKSFVETLADIQKLAGGFDQLKTIWQDVKNGKTFEWSNLIGNEALNSAFGNLGDVFDDFIRTVSNAPADLNACQNAFNQLASAYIRNSGVLNSLTEENRNAAVAMLESMGIANASIVVDKELAYQKERLKYSTGEFADMEYDEAYALYRASQQGEIARTVLARLALEKFQVNKTQIDTAGDIRRLIDLAEAAGTSASYVANLRKVLNSFNSAGKTTTSWDRGNHDARRDQEVLYDPVEYDNGIDLNFSVPDISLDSGGSGGGSSGREETWFEKQYKLHKHMIAMEQESVSDFLLWLDDAYKKAYEEGILTLDDYRQYEEEVFGGLKEIQDNAKAAIESLVDYKQDMLRQELEDEKDSLGKRLDNLKDFYDKQKDLLEKQRDQEKTENERSELRRGVQDIETDLQALTRDDSAWAAKRRIELEAELSEAKKSLDEFEKEQAFDLAMDALDSAYSAQEQQLQAEMDALDKKLNDPHALYNQALAAIQGNTLGLYAEMVAYNRKHGSGKEEDVSEIYEEAYKSLLLYQQMYGNTYEGVTLPNATGYAGYASGTAYASPGVHPVHENGYEYIFESADGSKYRVFQGGEMVLNARDTKFLYDFASNGGAAFRQLFEYIAKYSGTNGIGGAPGALQVVMGDVIVQGNADAKTVSQIRREQRNSIDYMLKELSRLKK